MAFESPRECLSPGTLPEKANRQVKETAAAKAAQLSAYLRLQDIDPHHL